MWTFLDDLHMGTAQVLPQRKFPSIGELQNTVMHGILNQSHTLIFNVAKQEGTSDCGLHAIMMMTSIADDPVNVIYNQQELRIHLQLRFESKIIEKFPTPREQAILSYFGCAESCQIVLIVLTFYVVSWIFCMF